MKNLTIFIVCAILIPLAGCASQQARRTEQATVENQKILLENEARLASLEESINALNTQVSQLNNRVYEVRTRTGQKTSMTVVPVTKAARAPVKTPVPAAPVPPPGEAPAENTPSTLVTTSTTPFPPGAVSTSAPAAQPAPAPAQTTAKSGAPVGRKIDPKATPAPLTAQAAAPKKAAPVQARGSIGQPQRQAGASGQLAALPPENSLDLPPTDLPPVNLPPARATTPVPPVNLPAQRSAANVPVPELPPLDLPPEYAAAPATVAQPVQAAPAPARTQPTRASNRGEEAAYNAALAMARGGRINEAIPMFQNFLREYPNGRYTANADYWLGECLYSQGKLQDALSRFQNVNQAYPKHHKNADALLKAGMTLSRLGDAAGAREKYRALIANFPNSDAARRARAMGVAR